jgi:hypothetical protein
VSGALTVVCNWNTTHPAERHVSGPPVGSGAMVSHGLCPECFAVEMAALRAKPPEKNASVLTLLLRTDR